MNEIASSYDKWSSQYDSNDNKTRDLDQHVTIKTLSNYSFSRVLELGCGTGKNTEWLVNQAEEIIGLDFSVKMLEIAGEKIQSDHVSFNQCDLNEPWNVRTNYFDLVTCSLTVEHIKDLDGIFAKTYETLEKDGIFFVSELHPFKQYAGSKARYSDHDRQDVELTVFTHNISDFLASARKSGFRLLDLNEWFDNNDHGQIPRLISFIFQK